jgi:hypothetical protein
VTELNAAVAVARAFLAGAAVTEATPWRPEYRRVTARLTEWIAPSRLLAYEGGPRGSACALPEPRSG